MTNPGMAEDESARPVRTSQSVATAARTADRPWLERAPAAMDRARLATAVQTHQHHVH